MSNHLQFSQSNHSEWLKMTPKEKDEFVGNLVIAAQRNKQIFRMCQRILFVAKCKKIFNKSKTVL